MRLCPCGSGTDYQDCCGVYISHQALPGSAEALMRSRYSAYVLENFAYIRDTMRSPAADAFDEAETRAWAQKITWLGLRIVNAHQRENQGTVEFIATYAVNNQQQVLHEISEFIRVDGAWYYISGVHPGTINPTKIGSNDPCPCGSAKKYKKC
jgi:SEC-C motif-containing protein